jgi:hypothetical protein
VLVAAPKSKVAGSVSQGGTLNTQLFCVSSFILLNSYFLDVLIRTADQARGKVGGVASRDRMREMISYRCNDFRFDRARRKHSIRSGA